MRISRLWTGLTGAPLAILLTLQCGCREDRYTDTTGPVAPRLSAALIEKVPGAPSYLVRVVVLTPGPQEFLSLSALSGAKVSLLGSSKSTASCHRAAGEQIFEVETVQGSSRLSVALGTLAEPLAPQPSAQQECAQLTRYDASESLALWIPSAGASEVALDGGSVALDAATGDVPKEEPRDDDSGGIDIEPADATISLDGATT